MDNQVESAAESRFPVTAECLSTPLAEWPNQLMAVFADRIEDAFPDRNKSNLEAVADNLETLLNHVLATAPAAVREAVLADAGDPTIRAAFLLGQLSFAHQFASSVASRRPELRFYEMLDDEKTKSLLEVLRRADSTKNELAAAVGAELPALARHLALLTEVGIVDFRRRFGAVPESGTVEYFLTPAAKQMTAG